MSTKQLHQCKNFIAEIVGMAVFATVITSSPLLIPNAIKEIVKASVPVFTEVP